MVYNVGMTINNTKFVRVTDKTHKKLYLKRVKLGLKSIEALIVRLLNQYNEKSK